MKRRDFFATVGLATVALSCNPTDNKNGVKVQDAATSKNQPILPPFHVPEGEGRTFWGPGGDKYAFLVTGKQSAESTFMLHAAVPPGGGPPPHIHTRESESYYVIAGELLFSVGGKTIEAKAGDFVHIPKDTVHTFTNKGKTKAEMLSIFAPAGMEGWFEEVLVPVKEGDTAPHDYTKEELAKMIEAGPRHGVTWRLPPETGEADNVSRTLPPQ